MWDLRTLAQFQGSELSPGLFQDFMDGYTEVKIRVFHIAGFL